MTNLAVTKKFLRTLLKAKFFKEALLLGLITAAAILLFLDGSLMDKYEKLESGLILDRNGEIISIAPNSKGEYGTYTDQLPTNLKTLLINKEDRYFYFHPGVNPVSTTRSFGRILFGGKRGGSSTITEQLAKNLLGNENDRTILNKVDEFLFAVSLEIFHSKNKLLTMYANTVYMGNNIQGLKLASDVYFGKELADLTDSEITILIATISNPAKQN